MDELFTPYVRPQENGNHIDTRWVALRDERGVGLLAAGDPTLDFSAHRFTTDDLDQAQHTYELMPRPTITLHLDYRQNGLGSGSCGPGVMPAYQLHAEPFAFGVWLRPLLPGGPARRSWLARFPRRPWRCSRVFATVKERQMDLPWDERLAAGARQIRARRSAICCESPNNRDDFVRRWAARA